MAMLVLNRYARRQHPENVPQNAQLGINGECAIIFRRGGPQVVLGTAMHDRRS
jgi:hypothetical protein